MRRYARSEKRREILQRNREGGRQGEEEEEERAGAAEIGSRVFPCRTTPPPAASMPTVGTRRSTRVFVSKKQRSAAGDGDPAAVLRSARRFAVSMASKDDDGSHWLNVFGNGDGDGSDLNRWGSDDKKGESTKRTDENKFSGVVYSRKRLRSTVNDAKDRKFGIVFERKHRRKDQKAAPLESSSLELFRLPECSRTFAEKLGILDSDLWSGLECSQLVLAVLVDSSVGYSSNRFELLILLLMNWMRRARAVLQDLVAFLFGRSILCSVFSLKGLHFLPIRQQNYGILGRNSYTGCGFCKIYGARKFVPILSVDFSAIPSYFKCLHAVMILGSLYLPSAVHSKHLVCMPENSLVVVQCEKHVYGNRPSEIEFHEAELDAFESPAMKREELPAVGDSSGFLSQNLDIIHGSRLRKHQRRRSLLKNTRARNPSVMISRFGSFRAMQNSSRVSSTAKSDFAEAPVSVKPPDSCLTELFSGREESDIASSPRSSSKLRKSAGMYNTIEKIKELKLALVEVRQDIDNACCNANILVNDTEKCWREEGAHVRLEMSGSQEWFIAVKRDNMTRFLHKPQDLKPYTINRYNHAYIWSGDDGWKLEFCDRWDWHVFKELHAECRERQTQDVPAKVIPVPGVREVPCYEEDIVPSFVRPDVYIHMMGDEVGRALASETSYYDMDSGDEEWLRHLNSTLSDAHDDALSHISEENFERIIFTFEKDAYSSPDDAFDKERVLGLCQELGASQMVAAIHDYWLKKKKQKRGPLVRVFQGPPLRRTPLIQRPFLRKKRSFKRQRSQAEQNQAERNHTGRGKPDLFMQAHQHAIRKVQQSEAAANRAADVAIRLRTRAQLLMSNADLLAYKAAMALRIAETIRVSSSSSESPDLDSALLFD